MPCKYYKTASVTASVTKKQNKKNTKNGELKLASNKLTTCHYQAASLTYCANPLVGVVLQQGDDGRLLSGRASAKHDGGTLTRQVDEFDGVESQADLERGPVDDQGRVGRATTERIQFQVRFSARSHLPTVKIVTEAF